MGIQIGWGRREFSLNEPISIPGQAIMRISEGILDPLYVTALCVDGGQGQDAVIFCSCDLTSLRGLTLELSLQKVAAMRPELPVGNIIMNTTHTHTSGTQGKTPEKTPDGKDIYPGEKFVEFLTDRCAEAICEAWDNRKPGGVAYGYGYAVVAHSRRVVYFDDYSLRDFSKSLSPNGHGVMYGNTNDAMFSHYEGGADHFLNAMYTFDESGKLTGILANVPCPSQVSEMMTMLSADYWHDVREAVKTEFGEGIYVLPQCAAAGDLSPRILHYKKAQARRMKLKYGLEYDPAGSNHQLNKCFAERKDIAQRITQGLKEIYDWAKQDIKTDCAVKHLSKNAVLSKRMVTEEEKRWCEDKIREMETQIPDPNEVEPEKYRRIKSRYDSVKNRNMRVIKKFEEQQNEPTIDMMLHVVQIGEIAFASNRFELYQDFQHRIQARSPFMQTFVVQLAGAIGGSYLPTERGVANKGYSACIFDNVVGPEGGQELVEQTLEMLNQLKEQ